MILLRIRIFYLTFHAASINVVLIPLDSFLAEFGLAYEIL
jgi:hypothetical protein